jgi:hypothetical protein
MVMLRTFACVLLLSGIARAELPKPDVLRLLPRGADCMARVDVDGVIAWRWRGQLLSAMPRLVARMRELGMHPLEGLRGISGASIRGGGKRSDSVFIVEGPNRGRGIALGPQRFVVGAGRWPAEVAKRARYSGERSPLVDAAILPSQGTVRGACIASEQFKANLRKDMPEIDGLERMTFEIKLDEGLTTTGSITLRNEAAATAMLARLKELGTKMMSGRVAGIISMRPFVEPLSFERRGSGIDFRYPMKPALIEQTLGMLNVMKNLNESSGDPLR